MSCECSEYDCVDAWINPCNTGTELNIIPDETGNWTARLEFNGMWREFGVSVTEDVKIVILTELFNEDYTHELRLYDIAGELFGCYNVAAKLSLGTPDAPIQPILNDTWQWATITTAQANTVTNDLFKGDISPIIWLNGQELDWAANGVTQNTTTGTLDFTALQGVSGSISFQYKNLPLL